MHYYNVNVPFERIAINITGPFLESQRENQYLLTTTDYFTMLPEVYANPKQDTSTVADVLLADYCHFMF
jgi:hypothetical protein